MIRKNKLNKYFLRKQNVSELEELIKESAQTIESIKEPKTKQEIEDYQIHDEKILTNKQAQTIMDTIYPIIQKLYDPKKVKKPRVCVIGNNPVKNIYEFQKNGLKYLTGGLSTISPMVYALGALVPEALILGVVPIVSYNMRTYLNNKNIGGWVDPFFKRNCYVRHAQKSLFTFALAHESTHSLQGQRMSIIEKASDAYTDTYLLSNEGLAEIVAADVTERIEDGKWNMYKKVSSFITFSHLFESYHFL